MLAEPELLETLKGLSPLSFEHWIADRFRVLGYAVQLTMASGDHGIDLHAAKGTETVIVQCKRYRSMTVSESVVRDLYGTMHHSGANRAILVTTGRFTPAALAWAKGKSLELWDGHELVRCWPAEIEELARLNKPATTDKLFRSKRGDNWFVYTTDDGRRWAVKLSPLQGNNPALGFERLVDPTLPELPMKLGPGRIGRPPGAPVRRVKMRYLTWQGNEGKPNYLLVPVGTKDAWSALLKGRHLMLSRSDGSTLALTLIGYLSERVSYDNAALLARARG